MRRTTVYTLILVSLVWVGVATGGAVAEPGVINGVEYNEEFDFERPIEGEQAEAVVSRAMARVEHLRGREFKRRPGVESVETEEVPGADREVNRTKEGNWNDVVWEALLIVGDDEYANQAIADTFGGATAGFYEPGRQEDGTGNESGGISRSGNISLVGDVDELTLAHELAHVMQDQYYNLSADHLNPPVQDEQLASDGVVEGEAQYIRDLYEERCLENWECYVNQGDSAGSGGGGETRGQDVHIGVLFLTFQPYSDGPQYVHEIVQREGWEGVDEAIENPPTTSREVIHREPHQRPGFDFEDESTTEWSLFDGGKDGYDVAGEASVFVTFWYQSHPLGYGLDVINTADFQRSDYPYSRYDYANEVSQGLAGDRIYPYYRETEEGEQNKTGFVWISRWDTPEDAELFASKYIEVLKGHGGENVGNSTWVVDSNFAGAYRIAHRDRNVTIVQAPTVEEIEEIHPIDGVGIDARPFDPRSWPSFFSWIPNIGTSIKSLSPGSVSSSLLIGVSFLLVFLTVLFLALAFAPRD